MRARAVIGANFGDEGKGLVVDWLCATQGAGIVVRYNGGSQAGHTVVIPGGTRHVFSHFGSGTFLGVPTFLSQFFVLNPIKFFDELDLLHKLGVKPIVYAHPECVVTTFADMIINQRIENKRAGKRHGSCGLGVRETIERSTIPELKITMSDLWNASASLQSKLEQICGQYAAFRTGEKIDFPNAVDVFVAGCAQFADRVHPLGIGQCKDPIFEGAQGLLLDQDNKEYFPHVTPSSTGLKNVRALCSQAGIEEIEPYFVSRTYLTRHGAGPLPSEDAGLRFEDDTNVEHDYQGRIRFAPLDEDGLIDRCAKDAAGMEWTLVMTHCDQRPSACRAARFFSHGPTRDDIRPWGGK